MCSKACIEFGRSHLKLEDVKGKKVIEVGSLDVNGALRPIVEGLNPERYIGVDIEKGPGVDEICNAEDLINHFGKECFDLVISTEMLEHIRNWRKVISNLKNLLKPNGVLLITTRSIGVPYHWYPFDFWRYELNDAMVIFSDLSIEVAEQDPRRPGIFVKARKPVSFVEHDLTFCRLYSIIKSKRCLDINDIDLFISRQRHKLSKILPVPVKGLIRRMLMKTLH